MEISKTESEYYSLRDECLSNTFNRGFRHILADQAIALIDLTVSHSRDTRVGIMRQAEKLTEVHMEWQSKISYSIDDGKWEKTARKSIRLFPYTLMKLASVVFPGKGDLKYSPKQVGELLKNVNIGVNMGTDFHIGWADSTAKCGDLLRDQWAWYGRMGIKMLASAKRSGIHSDEFYKAASGVMEASLNVGKILDEF